MAPLYRLHLLWGARDSDACAEMPLGRLTTRPAQKPLSEAGSGSDPLGARKADLRGIRKLQTLEQDEIRDLASHWLPRERKMKFLQMVVNFALNRKWGIARITSSPQKGGDRS